MKTRSKTSKAKVSANPSPAPRRSTRQTKVESKEEPDSAITVPATLPTKKNTRKRKGGAKTNGSKRHKGNTNGTADTSAQPSVVNKETKLEADAVTNSTIPTDGSVNLPVKSSQAPVSVANLTQTKPKVTTRTATKPSHTVIKPPPAIVPNPRKEHPIEEETVKGEEDATSRLRPVDAAIAITGNSADDFQLVSNDFDITLNQCNITGGSNNNKYYRIQLLTSKDFISYYTWTRWGRVGEEPRSSTSKLMGPYNEVERAQKEFEKKWKDKTGNAWSNRDNFVPKKGKYEPVMIDTEAEPVDIDSKTSTITTKLKKEFEPSKLDSKTRELIEVIHSSEIMEAQMMQYDIDVRRMPLGALDRAQVQRGAEILDEIKDALKRSANSTELSELTSRFYTAIPHSFGRSRPPVIQDNLHLQSKYDMLDVLLDIESTTSKVEEINKRNAEVKTEKLPHPADQKYDGLGAKLRLVDPSEPNHALVKKYFEKTRGYNESAKILDVWEVDRNGEGERFEEYAALDNHRLLWHGTGIAIVAAILGSGLRIMPHSGGRVGKGIYLANEMSKSAGYTYAYGSKYACMFLAEAALGRMKEITRDNPSIKKAPKSFHSVLAKGTQSPQEYVDTKIEGREVAVPQSEPVQNGIDSSFDQDEYLVYDEAQVRLRFVCTVKLGY